MRLYGLDIETDDPHLTKKGASWVYGEGRIIATGLYSAALGKKRAFDGNGGEFIKNLLLNHSVTLVGANIQYDLGWLCYEHGIAAEDVKCSLVDVAIAEQCVDEYQLYSLDALALKYLNERKGDGVLKQLCALLNLKGDFRKHLKKLWEAGYQKEIREYVVRDADQPVRIWEKQKKVIPEESMDAVITNFKLIKIVLGMKQRGVRIDMKKRKENYELLKGIKDKLQAEFEKKYGKVNFNSSKQLAALFERERIPYRYKIRIKGYAGYSFAPYELRERRKTLKEAFNGVRIQKGKLLLFVPSLYEARARADLINMGYEITSNPNIDKHALDKVKKSHEAAKAVVELKQVTSILDKFLGPAFDRFIVKHGPGNYRIHADFNIVGARQTGRFSSSNPNLQQVPSKTVLFAKTDDEIKLYKLCRETIIPDTGMLMGKADYSGQENRLMAHFAVGSGAKEVRAKYNRDPEMDFHKYIGEVSGLYEEYGADVGRKYAKNCSFGLSYGMQITTMCETFGWTKEQAEKITELYHEGAPFVRATMDRVSDAIVERGYIRTLAGRRSHLQSYNGRVDTSGAYKGFNKLIQGSAADMMKKALVMLDEKGLLKVFPLYLTVHDEIDFGIPKKRSVLKRIVEVKEVMENTFPLSVPIRVDPDIGKDWGHVAGRRDGETFGAFINRAAKKAEAA